VCVCARFRTRGNTQTLYFMYTLRSVRVRECAVFSPPPATHAVYFAIII